MSVRLHRRFVQDAEDEFMAFIIKLSGKGLLEELFKL